MVTCGYILQEKNTKYFLIEPKAKNDQIGEAISPSLLPQSYVNPVILLKKINNLENKAYTNETFVPHMTKHDQKFLSSQSFIISHASFEYSSNIFLGHINSHHFEGFRKASCVGVLVLIKARKLSYCGNLKTVVRIISFSVYSWKGFMILCTFFFFTHLHLSCIHCFYRNLFNDKLVFKYVRKERYRWLISFQDTQNDNIPEHEKQ